MLGPVSLTLARGDRVAVVGDNGSGKTTLVRALLGELPLSGGPPVDRDAGADRRRRPAASRCSRPTGRVLEVVRAELGADEDGAVRTLLAKFGLGVEHVHRPARSLSMGERTRALLALFQGRAVNVLVLDEPTNHLDVEAIEQLEDAVRDFTGHAAGGQPRPALLDSSASPTGGGWRGGVRGFRGVVSRH